MDRSELGQIPALQEPPAVWIKLYTELDHDDDWLHLSDAERGLLVRIWIEYALSRRALRAQKSHTNGASPRANRSTFHIAEMRDSSRFPLASLLARVASPEKREEKENPLPPSEKGDQDFSNDLQPGRRKLTAKELRRYTGCRYMRGSHGPGLRPRPTRHRQAADGLAAPETRAGRDRAAPGDPRPMTGWELDEMRDAYQADDPKHPDWEDLAADQADTERKRLKEEGPMELAEIEPDEEIVLFTGDPAARMQQMAETAAIIAEPVRARHTVTISGRQHVRVEGWTMLGALLGVHPYLVWSRPSLHDADDDGWEARVEARTRTGDVVGSAEAQCTRARENLGGPRRLRPPLNGPNPGHRQSHAATTRLRHHPGRLRPHTRRRNGRSRQTSKPQPPAAACPSPNHKPKKIYLLRDKLIKAGVLHHRSLRRQHCQAVRNQPSQRAHQRTSPRTDRHGLESRTNPHEERHARSQGWKPDSTCQCDNPQPVIYGGSGYWAPGLHCNHCRRRIT